MLHFVTCASIGILSQIFQNVTKCHRYLANQILSQKVTMSQAIHSLHIYKYTSVTFRFSRYEAGFQGNIEFQMVARQPFFFFAILSDKHQKLRMSYGKFEFSIP